MPSATKVRYDESSHTIVVLDVPDDMEAVLAAVNVAVAERRIEIMNSDGDLDTGTEEKDNNDTSQSDDDEDADDDADDDEDDDDGDSSTDRKNS